MSLNIHDLLQSKGITPVQVSTTNGGEYHSACPGCGGVTRFCTWPDQDDGRGMYWCRQECVKGNHRRDTIQFLIDFEKMSFRDACIKLGRTDKLTTANSTSYQAPASNWKRTPALPPPPKDNPLTPRENDADRISPAWRDAANKLLTSAETALAADPDTLSWLKTYRGITAKTSRRFRLGLIACNSQRNCIFKSRRKWNLLPRLENKKPDALWIPRGPVIPGFDHEGQLVRLRIRRPDIDHQTGGPKYYVLPGSTAAPMIIYNGQPALIVVESEFDAIFLAQEVGDIVGVVAMGSSSPRPTAALDKILKEANLILLAFDGDKAGTAAAEKWEKWYDNAYICLPPENYKDPCEAYLAGVDLRAWVIRELPSAWVPGSDPTAAPATAAPAPAPVNYEKMFLDALKKTYNAALQRHGAAFLAGINHLTWAQTALPSDFTAYQKSEMTIDALWKNCAPEADFISSLRDWALIYLRIAAACSKATIDDINDQLTRNRPPELTDNPTTPEFSTAGNLNNQNPHNTRAPPGCV